MANAVAVWHFRANETMTQEVIEAFMKGYAKSFAYQFEQGETGYKHWQGMFSLIKKKRKSELLPIFAPEYLEPAASKKVSYVMKEDTRILGPFTDKTKQLYIPIQYRIPVLRRWQEHLIQVSALQKMDFRTINILYCPGGNIGKSTLAGYLHCNNKGFVMPTCCDAERLIATACNLFSSAEITAPGIIFIDLPRMQEQKKMASIYIAIEQIKNGILYDTRYRYQQWFIDSPVIWVFTN